MEKIWKVRNFREIYRKEKRKKDHKVVRRKTEEVKEGAIRKKTMQFLRGHILDTPPQGFILSKCINDYREAQQKEVKKVPYQRFESPPLSSLRVIQEAEPYNVIQRYTMLNNDFTKRVKEVNREMDTKNINEKRATKSLMGKKYTKRLGVEEISLSG
ncbi:unnamed protein product [Rhizophagus irregularis]|nr:unnamed protein product [Rhizophagus irregularis]